MRHDPARALAFLRLLYPEGPWVLTCIEVDQKGIYTETFGPGRDRELAEFLGRHATCNCYYSVNRPIQGDVTSKLDRESIDSVWYLHVDIDPRACPSGTDPVEHLAAEQARIRALLTSPPQGIPRPTYAVLSGGGWNAGFALEEPIQIGGDIARAESAKLYNLALELAFGADSTHDISRILRLPHSVNYPNAKKRSKGRIPALAELAWFDVDRRFPLATFTQAPPIQPRTPGFAAALGARSPTVPRVPGNVAHLGSIEAYALPDAVRDKTKVLIVQGRDPEEPGPPDRSRIVFRVCCDLVRAGVDDGVLFAILTDPELGVSGHVIAQGSGKERCALRAIERAKEHAIDPHLLELNERHAVVENFGGKCRVLEEQYDPAFKRSALTFQSFDDYRNRYMNRRVSCGTDEKGRPIEVQLGKWWLDQAARRQYRSIAFSPGREIEGVYNLWRGFDVEPRPGDKHRRFMDHVRDDLCGGDMGVYAYLISWMARAVQTPDSPGEVAIVLRGRKGTGKCLKLGTKVLKHDGTLVNVEDVRVGDQLMGPDSRPRNVIGTTRGTGQLYQVTPLKGEPWICNDAHVLTLTSWESGELIDVPVEDYIAANVRFKRLHFQTFVGVDFPSVQEPLPIDPYFLGVWFGDGAKALATVRVTKPDSEIRGCPTYCLSVPRGGQRKNPLLTALRELVGNAATIPQSYLRASRQDRLAFLAGLLDTDGHLTHGCFEIVQRRRDYIDAIVFLGRSLGLQVTTREKIVKGCSYWRAFISGDCSVIPTRLPRKRAPARRHIKDVTRTGITIENAGIGEYAGFELDGDARFLLGDFTITHNSTFAKTFGALFGRHYWAVSDARHIVGNFNAHLRDCVILFGDEAFWAGDKKHESVLKTLITEDTIVIERKGVDAEAAPNYVHLIMASNSQWVVPASYDERRFLVLDVSATHMQDLPYWAALNEDLKAGGLGNLLYELQTRDLSNFNHRAVPKTEALQDQKVHSMESSEEWWYRKLSDGNLLPTHAGWEAPIPKDALIDDYLQYAQRLGQGKRASATALARFLARCTSKLETYYGTFRGRDPNGEPVIGRAVWYKFPPIDVCREGFSEQCGGPFKWPEIEVRGSAANPDPF